ncbi:MAG: ERF family protein [Alphaproteobacteria bacterium]
MSALVYQAINAVAAELAGTGIAKTHHNEQGEYLYRSIEDVVGALAPLLARHKLCILPRMLGREALACGPGQTGQLVTIRAAFDLVSALDGSQHRIESFGEAFDDSDKGSAKAMSAAYKAAMLQAFCIPVPQDEADARSPVLPTLGLAKAAHRPAASAAAHPEPPAGWAAWADEVIAIAASCESSEAIERLTAARRPLLAALQRSRPELYATLGEAIAVRLEELQRPARETPEKARARSATAARPGSEAVPGATAVSALATTAPATRRKRRKESAGGQPAEAA